MGEKQRDRKTLGVRGTHARALTDTRMFEIQMYKEKKRERQNEVNSKRERV